MDVLAQKNINSSRYRAVNNVIQKINKNMTLNDIIKDHCNYTI